jgi:hypothetical protein
MSPELVEKVSPPPSTGRIKERSNLNYHHDQIKSLSQDLVSSLLLGITHQRHGMLCFPVGASIRPIEDFDVQGFSAKQRPRHGLSLRTRLHHRDARIMDKHSLCL